jgi:hypothetical protein
VISSLLSFSERRRINAAGFQFIVLLWTQENKRGGVIALDIGAGSQEDLLDIPG